MSSTVAANTQTGTQTEYLPALREAAFDVHSQNGEDGIIAEILRRLGELNRPADRPLLCVEFGAWDGIHLSNTRHLIESHDADAVLIEPGSTRYKELVSNCAPYPGVRTICSTVESYGDKRLDALLEEIDCPRDFDLLSIDIDGHDYWVWHALRNHTPTIVVIEYNPTIPYKYIYPSPRDPSQRHGSSLSAIAELGAKKGYTLVAVTETNAVLVRSDRVAELRLADSTIDSLVQGLTDYRTFIFATPDGRLRLSGNRVMMWHGVVINDDDIKALPRFLRDHHDTFGPVRAWLLKLLQQRSRKRYEKSLSREQAMWDAWLRKFKHLGQGSKR